MKKSIEKGNEVEERERGDLGKKRWYLKILFYFLLFFIIII